MPCTCKQTGSACIDRFRILSFISSVFSLVYLKMFSTAQISWHGIEITQLFYLGRRLGDNPLFSSSSQTSWLESLSMHWFKNFRKCSRFCRENNLVQLVRKVMAQAQKQDFVFPWNGRFHLNRWVRQFSRLLAAEVCASAWVRRWRESTGYTLHSPVSLSLPLPCVTVCHQVPKEL